MKKQNKHAFLLRLSLVLLSLVMVLSVFAACNNTKNPGKDPSKDDPGKTDPGKDDPQEEPRIEIDLGEHNWNGAEYHVLEWSVDGQTEPGQSWIPWAEIYVETDDGDTIGSAVYSRNSTVEDKYGVKITAEYVSVNNGYLTRVRTNNTSGDDEFKLVTIRTYEMDKLVLEGLMMDLRTQNTFHFDQPWWVPDSVRSFALGDHLYMASTELLLRDKGATAAVFYNYRMAKDEGLTNLYELVDNKEWTMDKMVELAESVARSEDGNDILDSEEDIWGISGGDDSMYYMFNGSGQKFGHMDEDGYLVMDFGTGDTVDVLQEILEVLMYSDAYCNGAVNGFKDVFKTGNALFDYRLVKTVTGFRDMTDDYGILPSPLYDDTQENYSSLVWLHHDCVLGIPAATQDVEMASVILEALSYESYYTTYPKFYETVLMNRSTRDDDSKRMLQIVFDTRSYDPGQYWVSDSNLHSGSSFMGLTKTQSTAVASTWASYKNAVEKAVQKVNDWIDGVES